MTNSFENLISGFRKRAISSLAKRSLIEAHSDVIFSASKQILVHRKSVPTKKLTARIKMIRSGRTHKYNGCRAGKEKSALEDAANTTELSQSDLIASADYAAVQAELARLKEKKRIKLTIGSSNHTLTQWRNSVKSFENNPTLKRPSKESMPINGATSKSA